MYVVALVFLLVSCVFARYQPDTSDTRYDKLRQSTPCGINTKTAIANVRVFDGLSFSDPKTVVIDGCTISDDPSGADHLDASGMFLIPGLIESHAHPRNVTHLERAAGYGITTLMSLTCVPSTECEKLVNLPGLPDFHSPGQAAISPTDSLHADMPGIDSEILVSSQADVPHFLDSVIGSGAEYIKLVLDPAGSNGTGIGAIKAAVHGAEGRGYMPMSHASIHSWYMGHLEAGVSFMHHLPADVALTAADVERFPHHVVCPTLSMMLALSKPTAFKPTTSNYSAVLEGFSHLHEAGVVMVAGTDANDSPAAGLPSCMNGLVLHQELELMVEAGMTPLQALRSATVVPPRVWGFQDRGEIKPGMRADLLLLQNNPLEDITATRSIERVWMRGRDLGPPSGQGTSDAGAKRRREL